MWWGVVFMHTLLWSFGVELHAHTSYFCGSMFRTQPSPKATYSASYHGQTTGHQFGRLIGGEDEIAMILLYSKSWHDGTHTIRILSSEHISPLSNVLQIVEPPLGAMCVCPTSSENKAMRCLASGLQYRNIEDRLLDKHDYSIVDVEPQQTKEGNNVHTALNTTTKSTQEQRHSSIYMHCKYSRRKAMKHVWGGKGMQAIRACYSLATDSSTDSHSTVLKHNFCFHCRNCHVEQQWVKMPF